MFCMLWDMNVLHVVGYECLRMSNKSIKIECICENLCSYCHLNGANVC